MPPLIAVALVVLCEGLAIGAFWPVMARHVEQFGGTEIVAGLLFALVSLPKVAFNPLFGRWSDQVGRRGMLAVATCGTLLGSLAWVFAPNLWWLAASRLFAGVFGAQAALAQAVAADVSTPEKRAASVGVLGAAFGIAITIGPAAGGLIGARYSYAAVGWLAAALEGLSLLIILLLLRETGPNAGARRDAAAVRSEPQDAEAPSSATAPTVEPAPAVPDVHTQQRLLHNAAVVGNLAVCILTTIAMSVLIPTLDPHLNHRFGFSAAQTGYTYAALGLISALVQGGGIRVLVGRFGEKRTLAIGGGLLALGFVGLAIPAGLAVFWGGAVLIGVGIATVMPSNMGLLSRAVSPTQQGAAMGLYQAATGLARGAGNFTGGAVYDLFAGPATYALAAACSAAAVVVTGRLHQPDSAAGSSKQ